MGFWIELFTHTRRLFYVPLRRYNTSILILLVDAVQIIIFCLLLIVTCMKRDHGWKHRHGPKENTTIYRKEMYLWYLPHNSDTEHEIHKVVKRIEFNNDVKVNVIGFNSEDHIINEARKAYRTGNSSDIFVVEISNNSIIQFTLKKIQDDRNWYEMAFLFLTGAYGLGQLNITHFPIPCFIHKFDTLLVDVLYFTCFVNGLFVAHTVHKERSHNVDKAITLLGGNLSAYVLAWYIQSALKSVGLTILYCLIALPVIINHATRIVLSITFIVIRNLIATSFITACLLIGNSKAAIFVTSTYHIYMYFAATYITCYKKSSDWWAVLFPHLAIWCHCFPPGAEMIEPDGFMSCQWLIIFYYLATVLFGCVVLTPIPTWPHMIFDYCFQERTKTNTDLKVVEEPFQDNDDDIAFEIKSVDKMDSVIPQGFTLKVPYLKTTVILDASGVWRSSLLKAIVGNRCGAIKNVSVEKKHQSTMCMCPSYDFIHGPVTVKEALNSFCKIVANRSMNILEENIIEDFCLEDKLNIKVDKLSPVDKKLVTLAVTFLSDAQILILDDPTRILKNTSLKQLISCILKRKGQVTVLMTCSNGEDALRIADRIAIVVDGKIRMFGTAPFVITRLGIGTHIKLRVSSTDQIKDLFLYMWLFAPTCICLKKLNTEKDDGDDTKSLDFNFFISRFHRHTVEFIILNIRSKRKYFGIFQINISDVGVETVLERCKHPLLMESILYYIHHHAVPINELVEMKELKQRNQWTTLKEEAVKYSNVTRHPNNEEDLSPLPQFNFSEFNVASTRPAQSDMSFKDFINVISQRYNLKPRLSNSAPIISITKESQSEGSQKVEIDADEEKKISGYLDTNENYEENICTNNHCNRCFTLNDYCCDECSASTNGACYACEGFHFNSELEQRSLKILPRSLTKYPQMARMLSSATTFTHQLILSPKKSFDVNKHYSLTNGKFDKSSNCGDEQIKQCTSDIEKKNSCSNENITCPFYDDSCSDQEKDGWLSNSNNNSSVDQQSQNTISEQSFSMRKHPDSEEAPSKDAPGEDDVDLSKYFNLMIWGIEQKVTEGDNLNNRSSYFYNGPSVFHIFRVHTKTLFWMSAYHQWKSLPFTLFGFVLTLFIVCPSFFMALNGVDSILIRIQTEDIKDFIRIDSDLQYKYLIPVDTINCNDSECKNLNHVLCKTRLLFYGHRVMNGTNGVGIYYNEGKLHPKILSTAMAMESVQRIRQNLRNRSFESHHVSVNPMPLTFRESTKFLGNEMHSFSANAAFGFALASSCLIFFLIIGYLLKTLYFFQNLLILSGVSGLPIFFTQYFVCVVEYFVFVMLAHSSAYIYCVSLADGMKTLWKLDVGLLFVFIQLSYAGSVFSFITLLLQLTPKKIPIAVWMLFEVTMFGLLHTALVFSEIDQNHSSLMLILILISPTRAYTMAIYCIMQHFTWTMLLAKFNHNKAYWHPQNHLNQDFGSSDVLTKVLSRDAVLQRTAMVVAIHVVQCMVCFLVYTIDNIIRLKRTSEKKYRISDVKSHEARTKEDNIFTTCKPMQCVALYGSKDISGVSSIIQLIIGHNPFCDRRVTIGGKYFPQFCLFGSRQRIVIGYCPRENMLNLILTGRYILHLFARIRNVLDLDEAVDEVLSDMSLTEVANDPIYKYRYEDKRKLHVAMAMIGNPHILLLDHPTQGLDIKTKVDIWDKINAFRQRGHIVVLASDCADECCAVGTFIYVLTEGCIKMKSDMDFVKSNAAGYFTYVWLSQDDKGTTVPIVRVLREMQRRFYSGMFSMVDKVRDPYILFSFANVIPDMDHAKIYYALEDLKEAGLVRRYLVKEVTPPLILDAYKHSWLPY